MNNNASLFIIWRIIFSIILLVYVRANILIEHGSLLSWYLLRFNYLTSEFFLLTEAYFGWIIRFNVEGHLRITSKFSWRFYYSLSFRFLKLTLGNWSTLPQKIINFYVNILSETFKGILSLKVWKLVFPVRIVQDFLNYGLTLV